MKLIAENIMSKNKDICCYKIVHTEDKNRIAYAILTDKKSIEEVSNDEDFEIVSVSEVLKVLNG